MTADNPTWVGRFAPSPTGPLHLGSLFTALASYLDARARGGRWLVRMEDLDPPREVPGAAERILQSLRAHGLESDQPVVYQSGRDPVYREALRTLERQRAVFYCTCSRRDLGRHAGHYPGTCRERLAPPASDHAVRFRIPEQAAVALQDALQGDRQFVPGALSDFIVRRRDGLIAYHLAVVLDDAAQQVSSIVRGADLLDSTPLHCLLQQALGHPRPEYLHLPVLSYRGRKLSKHLEDPHVDASRAVDNLSRALELLGQPVPGGGRKNNLGKFLDSAQRQWRRDLLPQCAEIELSD